MQAGLEGGHKLQNSSFSIYHYICLVDSALLGPRQCNHSSPSASRARRKTPSISMAIENRKFSDFNNAYIPEIIEHLNAPRSGWIATWSDKNELGRPMHYMSGFSPAYLPYRLTTLKESNAWKIIILISLFNIFASGIFIIFFCQEIRLIPLEGLVAGMSMAFSPTLIN